MSVVGFDVGNLNCFVAVARAGGVETVANEYSDRCTPAFVAFTNNKRVIGVSAKNQANGNLKNTIVQFKRLIGRSYDDPVIQQDKLLFPYQLCALPDGSIGVEASYLGKKEVFSVTQIMASLLSELKTIAESNLSTKVVDCVVSVPCFFTDHQRKCYLEACQITGLNCLRLMNETTAVALSYGLYKQDLPAEGEKPCHIVFVDIGHASTQISVCAFNKGKVKVLSAQANPSLGGRDFDLLIQNYFADEIQKKYKLDVRSNPKAWARLGTESEKMKKLMSANAQDLPMNIECLMDDMDVSCRISRAQLEEMATDILERLLVPLKGALATSGLQKDDISAVEIVGGSTRIPAVKKIIESVFECELRTTLNADEAVARGCAIQCAMLSPTFKVRDIDISDATLYPICITWKGTTSNEQGEVEIFNEMSSFPATKMLTLHRKEPFELDAYYGGKVAIPHTQKSIGNYRVNGVVATASGEPSKIKVKVRLNLHGIFGVSSAAMIETLPKTEEPSVEPMETQPSTNVNGEAQETKAQPTADQSTAAPSSEEAKETPETPENATDKPAAENGGDSSKPSSTEAAQPKAKKQKSQVKSIDLAVDCLHAVTLKSDIDHMVEKENEMIMQVRLEKDRADAYNAVEEYVYTMRDKLCEMYEKYVSEEEKSTFSRLLDDTEDWLYGDGENQLRQVYADKLAELKKLGQPIVDRYNTHQEIPPLFEKFGHAVQHFRKILDLYAKKDETYSHIEAKSMEQVEKKVDEKFEWLNKNLNSYRSTPLCAKPPVMPLQIKGDLKIFEDFCNDIVKKPKPKVEPPQDKPTESGNKKTKDEASGKATNEERKEQTEEQKQQSATDMEVD